ncbi:unnamed protein product [Vitrella brassicaformis CCMP3155]|uniref:Uncharacterized protein n=1 Tax=Vitrella brassicaformis (strain CCMP3155) TaxID=1169540 RepID=A0A0G4EYK6_VITBC|nr:unnamed protein product [Vitrella brassicaformis CCMP3155]|eukprot:CEM03540.1 unnamed protein product [Vitrella brassicaformis CCMP3155]
MVVSMIPKARVVLLACVTVHVAAIVGLCDSLRIPVKNIASRRAALTTGEGCKKDNDCGKGRKCFEKLWDFGTGGKLESPVKACKEKGDPGDECHGLPPFGHRCGDGSTCLVKEGLKGKQICWEKKHIQEGIGISGKSKGK